MFKSSLLYLSFKKHPFIGYIEDPTFGCHYRRLCFLPLEEQLYNGPGNPLMVYASETLGPPPFCRA